MSYHRSYDGMASTMDRALTEVKLTIDEAEATAAVVELLHGFANVFLRCQAGDCNSRNAQLTKAHHLNRCKRRPLAHAVQRSAHASTAANKERICLCAFIVACHLSAMPCQIDGPVISTWSWMSDSRGLTTRVMPLEMSAGS